MQIITLLFALITIAVAVEASHEVIRNIPRNRKHSRSLFDPVNPNHRLIKRASKRCAVTPAVNAAVPTTTSTTKKSTPTTTSSSSNSGSDNQSGVIHVTSNECSNNGATSKVEQTSGPNGSEDFLNCGLTSSGGWNPPMLTLSEVITVDLNDALDDSNSPFQACKQFTSLFYQYADQYGLKAIMLASTAMQESTCNPNVVGAGGTQGLMQISLDKCDGAPGGNCLDPAFNIQAGAKYLSDTINQNGGNLLLAMGFYNGWYQGMTKDDATAAAYTGCCGCQQNLDYLMQTFNGWYQNDANSYNLGIYFNLNDCS